MYDRYLGDDERELRRIEKYFDAYGWINDGCSYEARRWSAKSPWMWRIPGDTGEGLEAIEERARYHGGDLYGTKLFVF